MLANALLRSIRTIDVISFLSIALKIWPVTSRLRVSVEWYMYLRFLLWWLWLKVIEFIGKCICVFGEVCVTCLVWQSAVNGFPKCPAVLFFTNFLAVVFLFCLLWRHFHSILQLCTISPILLGPLTLFGADDPFLSSYPLCRPWWMVLVCVIFSLF